MRNMWLLPVGVFMISSAMSAQPGINSSEHLINPVGVSGRQVYSESSRQNIQHIRIVKSLKPVVPMQSDDNSGIYKEKNNSVVKKTK
ncbi:hypothetical protein [Enterobacter hormaechei]|uniref:hypothetical protein n=1 Tax=Enterobacter hormaechei TaxID=158836 RepID=UPI0032DA0FC8